MAADERRSTLMKKQNSWPLFISVHPRLSAAKIVFSF
jgi:hypothetical protein